MSVGFVNHFEDLVSSNLYLLCCTFLVSMLFVISLISINSFIFSLGLSSTVLLGLYFLWFMEVLLDIYKGIKIDFVINDSFYIISETASLKTIYSH